MSNPVVRFVRSAFVYVLLTGALLLVPVADAHAQISVAVDGPAAGTVLPQPFAVSGWAVDTRSVGNSGIDSVAIYAAGPIGSGVLLGYAAKEMRPDVAAHFQRSDFVDSGYRFTVNGLPPGSYTFGVMVHSAVVNAWFGPYITSAVIPAAPVVVIDPVASNVQPFTISGLAGDYLATANSGISAIDVWAEPTSGAAHIYLGRARLGLHRPDAAAAYGPQFTYAGWDTTIRGLPPGQYVIRFWALSSITGISGQAPTPAGPISNDVRIMIDTPLNNALVAQPFSIVGAAADLAAGAGSTGVDAIHLYAQPAGTTSYIWLGAATPNLPRPDLAPYHGNNPQFANIGFQLDGVSGLQPGLYDLITFAHSTLSGQWTAMVTRIRVNVKAANPVLNPPSGEYTTPITVTAVSSTPGAVIRFELNGSDPTESSPVLTGPITVSGPGSARLRAFAPQFFPSDPVPVAYSFRAAPPVLSVQPGTYEGPVTFTATSPTPGAVIRYTTNEADPTEADPEYTGAVVVQSSFNARLRAFRSGWLPSAVVGGMYVIRPGAPQFSVASGTYTNIQTVTMSTATVGATIRYTIDGSQPTPSAPIYTTPLQLPVATTVKAASYDAAGASSSVSTLSIQYTTATPTMLPGPGVFSAPFGLVVASSTAHAVIRYTRDGSEPGASSPVVTNGGAIPVDRSQTVKIQAFVSGWPVSPTVTATYELRVGDVTVQPASGAYARPFSVSASVQTPGAVVRYSETGTPPTDASPIWQGLTNPGNGTYHLIFAAFRDGWTPSPVVSRQYVVTDVVTPTPSISPSPGVHNIGVTVTVTSADPQSVVRVTTDGTDPIETSPIYAGPITLIVPTTVKARAFKPNVVASNVAGGEYRLRLAKPSVNPPGGVFSSAPSLSITHAASGVTLRYTTDREEPTATSTVVPTCCIPITDNTTLKVVAFKSGWEPSDTVTNTYTIGAQVIPVSNTTLTVTAPAQEIARVSEALRISVSGTLLVASSVRITRNGTDVTAAAQITSSNIVVSNAIVAGENDIDVFGIDAAGVWFGSTMTFFGASDDIVVSIQNHTGAALSGAVVQLFDGAQEWPSQRLVSDISGKVRPLVPSGWVGTITAWADGYHTRVVPGASGATTVSLEPVNENFERGVDDWGILYPPDAALRPHIEGLSPWFPDTDFSAPVPGSFGAAADGSTNTDLLIGNHRSSIGASVNRTIRMEPGTRRATLRYRFFAQTQPLAYQMRLSVPGTSVVAQHATTAQSLQIQGLATLGTAQIQSVWLTLTVNLPPGSEEVRIEGALAADSMHGQTGAWLEIDQVTADGISMATPQLDEWYYDRATRTAKQGRLRFLSVGPKDQSSGLTQVSGSLAFNGSGTKRVASVVLEVRSTPTGTVRASVPIRADAGTAILNQPFPGSGGVLSTGQSRPLFDFTAAQMAVFSQATEEPLYLTVRAVDETGAVIPVVGGAPVRVQKLTDIMPDVTRDGGPDHRDPVNCLGTSWLCYGDAWARPTVHRIMRAAQQTLAVAVPGGRDAISISYNDFSNMNGGYFPVHDFHAEGRHIDGDVDGYLNRDRALARKMAEIVKEIRAAMTAQGNLFQTVQVLVEFNPNNPNDVFAQELRSLPAIAGRPALSYFVNGGRTHRDHFHVQMW